MTTGSDELTAAHTVPRVTDAKLAATVAHRLVADIADLGWPEGLVIGSEAELLERYGVSRAVFREAVRLVEHRQVALMRRGPGGGLVVAAVTGESVVEAVVIYLISVGVSLDELLEARLVLESSVAALASQRLTEADITALRELAESDRSADDPRELHGLVATITKNPAFEFFVEALNRMTFLFIPETSDAGSEEESAVADAHEAIIETIIAGKAGLSKHRMGKHLQAEGDNLRTRGLRTIDSEFMSSLDRSHKRAQSVAWALLGEIAEAGWPVGEIVGSEADLMARHRCSRAVLREAVRLLEYHEVALMRRGVGGGLLVTRPGIVAVTDAVALLLERQGITLQQLFEVRSVIEMAIVELAVERLTGAEARRLMDAVEREASVLDQELQLDASELHGVLARCCRNQVLELLSLVLVRLTSLRPAIPNAAGGGANTAAVVEAHEGLITAVLDRDLDLSRHRMRTHLEALSHWVR